MDFYGEGYRFGYNNDKRVDRYQFELHNHYGKYEIYVFIKGDADFVVEGTVYPLVPYDILIINSNEFHHILPRSSAPYERMVFTIDSSFFMQNSCGNYRNMFEKRKPGEQNLIPAEYVIQNGIPDIMERALMYASEDNSEIITRCAVLELVHAISKYKLKSNPAEHNAKVAPIITYINENLTSPLNIDSIAERFFLNKYHLCRLFKKHTGLTINKYITHKRITLVKMLYDDGKTLSQASQEAGFGNYSNFYKMYVKETGTSPRESIKKDENPLVQ